MEASQAFTIVKKTGGIWSEQAQLMIYDELAALREFQWLSSAPDVLILRGAFTYGQIRGVIRDDAFTVEVVDDSAQLPIAWRSAA